MGRAAVAVAHSMLVSAYYILLRDEPYRELGADWLARRNDQAHTHRLVVQFERLGTPWCWTRRCNSAEEELNDGLRPPALTRACNTVIQASVIGRDLDRWPSG